LKMRADNTYTDNGSGDPAGVLIVGKEKGMTSHDVVDLVRRRFSIRKAGHAGTLDPNATGVLLILLGRATKLSGTFLNEDKEYTARMKLGQRTDSGDSQGKVISGGEAMPSEERIRDVFKDFRGEVYQVPPMFSAKKIGGRKLYKMARKGRQVKREPRKIMISAIEVTGMDIPFVDFRVVCSKGTYIRQIADDIGEKLGCGAHLTELCRTRSGSFTLDRAVSVSRLKELRKEELYENIIRVQGSR